MRALIITIISLFAFLTTAAFGNEDEYVELERIANDVKTAVIKQDVGTLMQYVSPSGTYFIDEVYTYAQIKEMLENKTSWLYKHLFVGKNSVKNYFENAKNLDTKIHSRDNKAFFISYQSSNYNSYNWIECCFIRINGKWYFDGIFYCA